MSESLAPDLELVRALLEQPLLSSARLAAGFTNRNYQAETATGVYVVRLASEHSDALGIDRRQEKHIAQTMSEMEVGAPLVRFDLPSGHMVTRFLPGTPWYRPRRQVTGALLDQIADLLDRIHGSMTVDGHYDPLALCRRYLDQAGSDPRVDTAAHFLAPLERTLAHDPRRHDQRLCHNDLSIWNLFGDAPRVLDWEYAGMGSPWFDLATLCVSLGLDQAQESRLLARYFRGDADPALLTLYKRVYFLREASWALAQLGGHAPRDALEKQIQESLHALGRGAELPP